MSRLLKKRSKKSGLPPGSLVYVGEQITKDVKITVIDYDDEHFEEKIITTIEESYKFKDTKTVTWINIDGVHRSEIIEKIGKHFDIHSLILEDILNTAQQHPKMDDLGNYIFVILKMLSYDEKQDIVNTEQVSLILGSNYVISFQEGKEGDVFDPIRERIRTSRGRIRKMGADYLVYELIDIIIDNYFLILEKLGDRIEDLEEKLVNNPTPETLRSLHKLKREMIMLRKSVWPLREVVNRMERGESFLIKESTAIYLRDVYDHTIQVIDTIETFRDIISGMVDIYLSSISNRMNEIMKVLTIIATIFIPLTFIVGIYGMNFKYMPEIEWHWGYPAVWIIMIVITVFMLIYFKKKKWL